MKVKILAGIAGTTVYRKGEIVEMSEIEARRWLAAGVVEPVHEAVDCAMLGPAELAVGPAQKKKARTPA